MPASMAMTLWMPGRSFTWSRMLGGTVWATTRYSGTGSIISVSGRPLSLSVCIRWWATAPVRRSWKVTGTSVSVGLPSLVSRLTWAVVVFRAWVTTTCSTCAKSSGVLASKKLPTHRRLYLSFSVRPTPMTKGLSTMPLACRARLTAQGSSSQASMPSVIRMMMLRTVRVSPRACSGKSSAAFSSERAMGVVPRHRVVANVWRMAGMLLGLKGTSRRVSSQSCCPGWMGVWWP